MLFNLMKSRGHRCELILEVAKHATYAKQEALLADQFLLMCKQEHAQKVCIGQVDYIITDSPPELGVAYASGSDLHIIRQMAAHFRSRYKCLDIFVDRPEGRHYEPYGRNQTADEAKALHNALLWLFNSYNETPALYGQYEVSDEGIAERVYERFIHGA